MLRELRRELPSRLSGLIPGVVTLALATGSWSEACAQDREAPGGFRVTVTAVEGARIVVRPGEEIESGNLVIRNGRVEAIGADARIPVDAEVINGQGMVVYAGFLDAGTDSFLDGDRPAVPASGVRPSFQRDALVATREDNRRGLTPEFEARQALRDDRDLLDRYRRAGFTAVHVIPTRAIAAGQGCCLSVSGAPQRVALLQSSTFGVFRLEAPPRESSSSTSQYPITLMGAHAHIRQAFLDADRYAQHLELYEHKPDAVEVPSEDTVLAALHEIRAGDRPALFIANSRDGINRVFDFAEEHGLKPTFAGGRDGIECLERLQAAEADTIIELSRGDEPEFESDEESDGLQAEQQPPLRFQEAEREKWRRRIGTAATLQDAGLRFAFSTRGADSPAAAMDELRTMVEKGLDADVALAALTEQAAAILGLDDRLGTLEPGKLGQVVVMTGPWHDPDSKVRYSIIDGRTFEYNEDAESLDAEEPGEEPTDLAGRWIVHIEAGDMRTTNAVLELVQDDQSLSGTFTSEQGNGRVRTGTVDGAGTTFRIAIGAGDRSIELSFEGTFSVEEDDHTLSGTLTSPFGAPTGWSATKERETPPESDNPVQLSLDSEGDDEGADQSGAGNEELPTELDADRTRRTVQTGGDILLQNGTILTGVGETLAETDILIRNGRIEAIGLDLNVEEGVTAFDVAGWYVMPGMIDTHTHMMISGGVNESSQSIVPEVRVEDVVSTDDVAEYRALAGGLTTARLLHGSSNVIGGQDAVVKLRHGTSAVDHLYVDNPQGVKFALGENVKRNTERFPNTRMGVEATLQRGFFEALDYRRVWQEYQRASERGGRRSRNLLPPRRDLRLDALAAVIEQEILVHCHCYRADEILMLLRTADELGISRAVVAACSGGVQDRTGDRGARSELQHVLGLVGVQGRGL